MPQKQTLRIVCKWIIWDVIQRDTLKEWGDEAACGDGW